VKTKSENLSKKNIRNAELARDHINSAFSHNDLFIYSALITAASLVLIISRTLRPSPNGWGTHEQLGLPACMFLKLTGFPCPGCGLTTSFAHAARLNFYDAFLAQPFGLIAFCLTLLSIPFMLFLMHRRIGWMDILYARITNLSFYWLLAIYLGSWIYKIAAIKLLTPWNQ